MTGFDLHPEELLDRVRRGQASSAERERVQQHLQRCEACRFEHALLAQSTSDAAPQPGDAARARRIEQAAVAALAARGVLAPGKAARVVPARRRRAGALIAAAIVSSLATAAAAAVIQQPQWLAKLIPLAALQRQPAPEAAQPHRASHGHARAPMQIMPAIGGAAPVIATPVPVVEPAPASVPDVRPAGTRPGPTRDAGDLFAAANLARREHQTRDAARLYRELARKYPRSPEAAVSQVALGRLLLDRAGDARGALREFDAYLAGAGERALREDALIGRALSLGRLGRGREEHAAWKALLAAFPRSAYAERARARLIELRCAVESC